MLTEKTKVMTLIIVSLFIIYLLAIVVTFASTKDQSYNTDPLKNNNFNTFLGDDSADNSILFVFDYSCPYCHDWIKDVFPSIENEIQKGNVKFTVQSMVYVDSVSLSMSKFDQNLKRYYPEQYFDIFFRLFEDVNEHEWASEDYLLRLIKEYHLDKELLFKEPEQDVITVTRKFTRELELEAVPALFINQHKVDNPFDLKEIQSYFQ